MNIKSKIINETIKSIDLLNEDYLKKARQRLDSLTKPKHSLGMLEDISSRIVAIKETVIPTIEKKAVFVFASDHGITAEGISAYPPEVTAQMVYNFLDEGAAINAISMQTGTDVYVADIGVDHDFPDLEDLLSIKISRGTNNFLKNPAMTSVNAVKSLESGIKIAEKSALHGYDLIAGGEMGIGNTTSAAAVICLCLDLEASEIVGFGTGIDKETWILKVEAVDKAIKKYGKKNMSALDVLSSVGGYEIGGIAGLMLGCAKSRIPVVADGFISTAAACIAIKLCPAVFDYLFFSHISSEKGHKLTLEKLNARPILDLDLRLGEGTGAVLAFPIIESALSVYNNMNTFEEAGVSGEKQ